MLDHISSLYDNVFSLHLTMQHLYKSYDMSIKEYIMSMKECDKYIQIQHNMYARMWLLYICTLHFTKLNGY